MVKTKKDFDALPDAYSNSYDKPLSYYLPKVTTKYVKAPSCDEALSEDRVILRCTAWLKLQGWVCKKIYTGGVPLPGGKLAPNPAKGIPDYICFHPETKRTIWIEFKKSKGGLVSDEQQMWHKLLAQCSQEIYVINSLELLKEKVG